MGIKVEVTKASDGDEIEYPCFMLGKHTGCIVLFGSADEGTVIYKGTNTRDVGKFYREWSSTSFTPFKGKITMENK